jgi:hypothetical protein
MPEVDLVTLADAGAFVSREHQAHLQDTIGIADWRVDAGAGTFAFTDAAGAERRVRAHLIGTASPTDGVWRWGWQQADGFPAAFVRRSSRVRDLGERYGIPELTTGSLPLDDDLPQTLVDAVKAVTGTTAHHVAGVGPGDTVAWLLLDDPSLALPAPTVARAVGVVTSALAAGGATDHRRALTAWAEQRHATLTRVEDDLEQLTLSDGSLQVRFDASGHISGLGRRLRSAPKPVATTPEPEPAPVVEERIEVPPPLPARRGLLQRLLGR